MAKFDRYDPRNKKKDRNKKNSLNKDVRIREEESRSANQMLLREIVGEDDYIEQEPQQLQG
jgi:hypothetical protein